MESAVPDTVRSLVAKICADQNQPPINGKAWELLAEIGEQNALLVLNQINSTRIQRSFSGFITYLVDSYRSKPSSAGGLWSPTTSPAPMPYSPSSSSRRTNGEGLQYPQMSRSTVGETVPPPINRRISFEDEAQPSVNRGAGEFPSSAREVKAMGNGTTINQVLSKLEFRKQFMVLSYIGRKNMEDVMTLKDANDILTKNNLPMPNFESEIWQAYGKRYCDIRSRCRHFDWDSGKAHLYHCSVEDDGCCLKGPSLYNTRTHLQRSVGDDNVLMVKFIGADNSYKQKIAHDGIFVGQKHYQFFVFKDDRTKAKNNEDEKEKKASWAPKCYFVHIDSGKSTTDARRSFMHVHTLLTVEKYMARFSLILSKTIKLDLDFGAIQIITIEDIPFRDEAGSIMHDDDGKVLVHTDGTGFISEDLAMQCPKDFASALYMKDNSSEKVSRHKRARVTETPLLMQCRLFYYGCAVKGTLLLNKKLGKGTILVRPSMIKVERDQTLPNEETFNSLEVVSVSHKPGRNFLSRNLIALLTYGGVPQNFFLDLLKSALEDARNVYSNKGAALKVAVNHDGFDYATMAVKMISSGIPLNEPYLQHCLSYLNDNENKKLREGKIPIEDSFYLMGTTDPTGLLEYDEVCVISDHGPVVGDVLVYRNPGLHFGDVHVMNAVYKKEMEDFIGSSRYAIFFSTRGSSSAAYEMATGDFDGDMYWISRNPELLKTFKASEPWKSDNETQDCDKRKLHDSKLPESSFQLEQKLFQLFWEASNSSFTMAKACHSWQSFMDRLLTLRNEKEKDELRKKMNRLINIYYDALDAPKSGKKVNVPGDLIAEKYPHYMEKAPELTYNSTSLLGIIYDTVKSHKREAVQQELFKLPCFDVQILDEYMTLWKGKYTEYCKDMSQAMNGASPEEKSAAANKVFEKYRECLYDANDFEESTKDTEQIYQEALAVYHVTYNHVIGLPDETKNVIKKLGFAWNVAGSALCSLHAYKTVEGSKEKPVLILPSVLREALGGNPA